MDYTQDIVHIEKEDDDMENEQLMLILREITDNHLAHINEKIEPASTNLIFWHSADGHLHYTPPA